MHLTYIIENYFNKNYNNQSTYTEITGLLSNFFKLEQDDTGITIYATKGASYKDFSNFGTVKQFAKDKTKALAIVKKIIDWDKQALQVWQEMQKITVTKLIDVLTSSPYDFNEQANNQGFLKGYITYNPSKSTNLSQLDQELAKNQAPDYDLMFEGLDNFYKDRILETVNPIQIKNF